MKFYYDRQKLKNAARIISRWIDRNESRLVGDLCRLVEVDTVNTGMVRGRVNCKNKSKIFRTVETLADRFGLKHFRIGTRGVVVEWGAGKSVITVPLHLDVVHAGSDWTYPPFKGTVVKGKIFGRGTSDNKGPCASALYGLAAVKENKFFLTKKIRLVYSADEEAGVWVDMRACLKKLGASEFAVVQDSLFPVVNAEKGFLDVIVDVPLAGDARGEGRILKHFSGGLRSNMVPDRALAVVRKSNRSFDRVLLSIRAYNKKSGSKIRVLSAGSPGDFVFEAVGKSAHGSRPQEGRNAVIDLAGFLCGINLVKNKRLRIAELFFRKIGNDFKGKGLGIAAAHKTMGPLTVNLGHVTDDGRTLRFILNIRYPVGKSAKQICRSIEKVLPFPYKISIGQNSLKPFWISPGDPHIRQLSKAFEVSTGQKARCVSMAGTTYAKLFKKAAGFGPLLPHEPGRAHMPDEYLPVKVLTRNAKALATAYLALGGRP